ncbi:MAG: VWA domain-containing protein [Sandaracinaceae bacterium]
MSGDDSVQAERRWLLCLGEDDEAGVLTPDDQRIQRALSALYDAPPPGGKKGGRGSLGRSAPRVSRWLGDIRELFPSSVVQVIQRDAFERLGLRQMLLQPEFLAACEADVHLVADLMSLRASMPDQTLDAAREVIRKVVDELMERLAQRTAQAVRGAVSRAQRTRRPRAPDIDWPRTLAANLRHYQPEHRTVIPEVLIGVQRRARRLVDLDEVVLCVDQSGSMATSVVYASIFAAVMASLPAVRTQLVCFDTTVLDLTDELEDPVQVLFGVQLGGGTDIHQAVAYCEQRIERPTKSHLILLTDLYEGGDPEALVQRLAHLLRSGVNVIVLLALTDTGSPGYDGQLAETIAALGAPVFACTPDRFPDLMATALRREDVHAWAATNDIKLVRAGDTGG